MAKNKKNAAAVAVATQTQTSTAPIQNENVQESIVASASKLRLEIEKYAAATSKPAKEIFKIETAETSPMREGTFTIEELIPMLAHEHTYIGQFKDDKKEWNNCQNAVSDKNETLLMFISKTLSFFRNLTGNENDCLVFHKNPNSPKLTSVNFSHRLAGIYGLHAIKSNAAFWEFFNAKENRDDYEMDLSIELPKIKVQIIETYDSAYRLAFEWNSHQDAVTKMQAINPLAETTAYIMARLNDEVFMNGDFEAAFKKFGTGIGKMSAAVYMKKFAEDAQAFIKKIYGNGKVSHGVSIYTTMFSEGSKKYAFSIAAILDAPKQDLKTLQLWYIALSRYMATFNLEKSSNTQFGTFIGDYYPTLSGQEYLLIGERVKVPMSFVRPFVSFDIDTLDASKDVFSQICDTSKVLSEWNEFLALHGEYVLHINTKFSVPSEKTEIVKHFTQAAKTDANDGIEMPDGTFYDYESIVLDFQRLPKILQDRAAQMKDSVYSLSKYEKLDSFSNYHTFRNEYLQAEIDLNGIKKSRIEHCRDYNAFIAKEKAKLDAFQDAFLMNSKFNLNRAVNLCAIANAADKIVSKIKPLASEDFEHQTVSDYTLLELVQMLFDGILSFRFFKDNQTHSLIKKDDKGLYVLNSDKVAKSNEAREQYASIWASTETKLYRLLSLSQPVIYTELLEKSKMSLDSVPLLSMLEKELSLLTEYQAVLKKRYEEEAKNMDVRSFLTDENNFRMYEILDKRQIAIDEFTKRMAIHSFKDRISHYSAEVSFKKEQYDVQMVSQLLSIAFNFGYDFYFEKYPLNAKTLDDFLGANFDTKSYDNLTLEGQTPEVQMTRVSQIFNTIWTAQSVLIHYWYNVLSMNKNVFIPMNVQKSIIDEILALAVEMDKASQTEKYPNLSIDLEIETETETETAGQQNETVIEALITPSTKTEQGTGSKGTGTAAAQTERTKEKAALEKAIRKTKTATINEVELLLTNAAIARVKMMFKYIHSNPDDYVSVVNGETVLSSAFTKFVLSQVSWDGKVAIGEDSVRLASVNDTLKAILDIENKESCVSRIEAFNQSTKNSAYVEYKEKETKSKEKDKDAQKTKGK